MKKSIKLTLIIFTLVSPFFINLTGAIGMIMNTRSDLGILMIISSFLIISAVLFFIKKKDLPAVVFSTAGAMFLMLVLIKLSSAVRTPDLVIRHIPALLIWVYIIVMFFINRKKRKKESN